MVLSSNNQGLLHWLRIKKNRQQQQQQQPELCLGAQHTQQAQQAPPTQHPCILRNTLHTPLPQEQTLRSQSLSLQQSPEPPPSPASSQHRSSSSAYHELHQQVQAFQNHHRQHEQHGARQDAPRPTISVTRRQRTLQHAPHAPHSQQPISHQDRYHVQQQQRQQQQQHSRQHSQDSEVHRQQQQQQQDQPARDQQAQRQQQQQHAQQHVQQHAQQHVQQHAQHTHQQVQRPVQPTQEQQLYRYQQQQQQQQQPWQQQLWHPQHEQEWARQQELQQQQRTLQESGARAILSSQSRRFSHTPLPVRSVVSTTRPRSVASSVNTKRWSSATLRAPPPRPHSVSGWSMDDTRNQDKAAFVVEDDTDDEEEEISITRVIPQYISPLSRLVEGTVSIDEKIPSRPLLPTSSNGGGPKLQHRNSIEANSQRSFAADSATPSFARSNSVSLLLEDDWQLDMSSAASPVMESSMQTPAEENLASQGLGTQQYTCHLNASFHGYSPSMPSSLNAAPLPPQLYRGLAHTNAWPLSSTGASGIWIKQFEDEGALATGPCGEVRWGLVQQQHMALKLLSRPVWEYLNSCPDLRLRLEHALCTAATMRHQNVTRVIGFSLGPDPTNQRMSPVGRMSPAGRSTPSSGREHDMFVGEELMDFSLAHYLHGRGEGKLMRLDDVIGVGMTVASALSALHSLGVGHFGVHPNNILLDSSGNISLGDVGLASLKLAWRLRNQCVPRTAAPYMAPECFSKCSGGITMQADLYSLGILLWECLMGCVPWSGLDTADIVVQAALHNRRPPLPLNALRCPPALANIISELWHPSPWCRPDTMRVYSRLADLRARLLPNLFAQPRTPTPDTQHWLQQQQLQHEPSQVNQSHGPRRDAAPVQLQQQPRAEIELDAEQGPKSGSLNLYASSWDTDSEECEGQPADALSHSVSSSGAPAAVTFKVHHNQLVEHMMHYKH